MKLFPPGENSDAERIGLEEFFREFQSEWDKLKFRFFKLERQQAYQEPDDPSYQAFARGDLSEAIRLVRERIREQKPLYEVARQKGIDIIRVRVVERPLSDYLQYEFEAYKVSQEYGEQVRLVMASALANDAALARASDFLLFDHAPALIHDYDPNGLLCDGWIVRSISACHAYEQIANRLMSISVPFTDYERPLS